MRLAVEGAIPAPAARSDTRAVSLLDSGSSSEYCDRVSRPGVSCATAPRARRTAWASVSKATRKSSALASWLGA